MTKPYKHAFVIGKFLPPHLGHIMLLEAAAAVAEHVVVAVEQQDNELVSVDTRIGWLQASCWGQSHIDIRPLYGSHPCAPTGVPEEDAVFWKHWQQTIKNCAPDIDVVVSADDYGARLAHDQNAAWMPVDRSILPTSATLIKQQMWERFALLVKPAQHAFLRRLVVVGAESTGKSILAPQLAAHPVYPTMFCPEYAQFWINKHPNHAWDASVLETFLHGQSASVQAVHCTAERFVVEDSHALTTAVWAQYLGYDDLAQHALNVARASPPHHVLLCSANNAPWMQDVHRPTLSDRPWFEQRFCELLQQLKWPHTIVDGHSWEERTTKALKARDDFVRCWHNAPWTQWAHTMNKLSG